MTDNPRLKVYPTTYAGTDPDLVAKASVAAAETLEAYLVGRRVDGRPQTMLYSAVAQETGVDLALVQELLFCSHGGSNYITF